MIQTIKLKAKDYYWEIEIVAKVTTKNVDTDEFKNRLASVEDSLFDALRSQQFHCGEITRG